MSLMMTSAQGSKNQIRPSKMLLTKKLVGMKTTCGSSLCQRLLPPCLQWIEPRHDPARVPLAGTLTGLRGALYSRMHASTELGQMAL